MSIISKSDAMVLENVIRFSTAFHAGQTRLNGMPYIAHVLRVMNMGFPDAKLMAIGALHDVVEDTSANELHLSTLFPPRWHEAVLSIMALTKEEGMTYKDQVEKACGTYMSMQVKVFDMQDNFAGLKYLPAAMQRNLGEKYTRGFKHLLRIAEIEHALPLNLTRGVSPPGCEDEIAYHLKEYRHVERPNG